MTHAHRVMAAAQAAFAHRYPQGFGEKRQSWDALEAEAGRPVSNKAAHIESAGPRRARAMLDGYLAEAKVVLEAVDAVK